MIHSMTGFGKATARLGARTITVSIKSLNSKQADIAARIPSRYRETELELRALVADSLQRGKIELLVQVDEDASSASSAPINKAVLLGYIDQLKEVGWEAGVSLQLDPAALLRLPGVLETDTPTVAELTKEERELLRSVAEQAVADLQSFRAQEGRMLYDVLRSRIEKIGELLQEIAFPEAERITAIRERLEEGLSKIAPATGFDRSRLEQEMIYYIEKLDINEEKSRLAHHLSYFLEVLDAEVPGQGKTLGFIAQEIGREINTMGSKSNQAEMQQLVVKMKDELEQIKEQVLNVL